MRAVNAVDGDDEKEDEKHYCSESSQNQFQFILSSVISVYKCQLTLHSYFLFLKMLLKVILKKIPCTLIFSITLHSWGGVYCTNLHEDCWCGSNFDYRFEPALMVRIDLSLPI